MDRATPDTDCSSIFTRPCVTQVQLEKHHLKSLRFGLNMSASTQSAADYWNSVGQQFYEHIRYNPMTVDTTNQTDNYFTYDGNNLQDNNFCVSNENIYYKQFVRNQRSSEYDGFKFSSNDEYESKQCVPGISPPSQPQPMPSFAGDMKYCKDSTNDCSYLPWWKVDNNSSSSSVASKISIENNVKSNDTDSPALRALLTKPGNKKQAAQYPTFDSELKKNSYRNSSAKQSVNSLQSGYTTKEQRDTASPTATLQTSANEPLNTNNFPLANNYYPWMKSTNCK